MNPYRSFEVLRIKETATQTQTQTQFKEEILYITYTLYTAQGIPIAEIDFDQDFEDYSITINQFVLNTSRENKQDIPIIFALNHNYPNLFNLKAQIVKGVK